MKNRTVILTFTALLILNSLKSQETEDLFYLNTTPFLGALFSKNLKETRFNENVGSTFGIKATAGYRIGKKFGVESGLAIERLNFSQSRREIQTFVSSSTFYEKVIGFKSFSIPLLATYRLSESGRLAAGFNLMLSEWTLVSNSLDQSQGPISSGVFSINDNVNEDLQFIPEFTLSISGGLFERVSIGIQTWISLANIDAGFSQIDGQVNIDEFEYSWIRVGGFLSFRIIK